MYQLVTALSIALVLTSLGCTSTAPAAAPPDETVETVETTFRIALGSCADQDKPQPVLDVAVAQRPDVFIYLGDNIYGDSYTLDTIRAKYDRLASRPEFQRLKAAVPLLATWDDHDYGWNDAGRHFPQKAATKALFLDFWEVPANSTRRQHPGIYGTEWLEKDGRRIQIILLDTRTFRDDLIHRQKTDEDYKNDYVPNQSPDSTFLGSAQWAWLEEELRLPADVRIIASSNQFSHRYNGWESWTNVPHEQQRMLNLIRKTKANGVIFLSGDVHWGEVSRLASPDLYPIYDLTSSGINKTWGKIEPNANRRGKAIPQNNIGLVELSFGPTLSRATLSLFDVTGERVVEETVDLNKLRIR